MSIQNRMFEDLKTKAIFKSAQEYGFDYVDSIFSRNVFPTEKALEDLSNFDEELPIQNSDANSVLTQLYTYGNKATTATLGGRYFGFVCGSAVPVGFAAKNLASFWDQSPTMNVLSPIGNKLESVVQKWLVELFKLPKNTVARFVSGTSAANLCAIAAARYRIYEKNNWNVNTQGLRNAPEIRIITSKQAHSTVLKAINILGLGTNTIEWVDIDAQGRIIPEAIPELCENSLVILQAGNVNSGAYDNFEIICDKAQQANAWVHIDGAFGLWAQTVNELKHLTKGIEKANSWAVDGHKTLNTPYDSGIVLCKDKDALINALHMSGSYIITSKERDGMFYTPEMSRRARVIELWAIIKYLGKKGIDEMILNMHRSAKQFALAIQQIDGFEVKNDVVFNQVLVSCKTDELTEKTLQKVQELRDCWLGGSVWFDKKVMRVSICSWATTEQDINIAVKSFEKALSVVLRN